MVDLKESLGIGEWLWFLWKKRGGVRGKRGRRKFEKSRKSRDSFRLLKRRIVGTSSQGFWAGSGPQT